MKKVELTNEPELILSYEIINKIRYLCDRIDDVEWSGVLFYSTKGTIKYPSDLKLIAEDIFLMDKGSGSYTEYDTNGSLIEYIMKNKLQNFQRAHIHSHNSMDTFFSGIDMGELHDNSEFYNYYLSLIVNNAGDMTAKIAMRGKRKVESNSLLVYNNEDGKKIRTQDNQKSDEDVLFLLDCDIVKLFNVPESFRALVEKTIKECEDKKKQKEFDFSGNGYNNLDTPEELLVQLLLDDDNAVMSLKDTLSMLDSELTVDGLSYFKNIEEFISDIRPNINYVLIGTKNEEFILNNQVKILKVYKSPLAKAISVMLEEYIKELKEEKKESLVNQDYFMY